LYFILYFSLSVFCLWSAAVQRCRWRCANSCPDCNYTPCLKNCANLYFAPCLSNI